MRTTEAGGTVMRLTPNFTLAELTRTSTGLPNQPNTVEVEQLRRLAVHILQPLRESVGVPVLVSSGYRGDRVNRAVGGVPTSQHRLGQAADISTREFDAPELAQRIVDLCLPFDQLIQEFGRWVHVSYGPRHRRQVLTAVKRDGRTVYLPGLV